MSNILVLGLDDFIQKFKLEYSEYIKKNKISFYILKNNISVNEVEVDFTEFSKIIYMNDSFSKKDYDFSIILIVMFRFHIFLIRNL